MITPIHNVYGALIGPVPVWVDVVFTLTGGYTAHFEASAEITNGISASKTISVTRKWDAASNQWQDILYNPPVSLDFVGPIWQMQGSADIRAYLQPKVTLLIYSVAGVSADLEPYLELQGDVQLNPYQWDLGLYAGLDSTIGLDLSVWDDSWPDRPSIRLNLIPRRTLWQDSGPPSQPTAPQITVQPQSQTASVGSTVSFAVQAQGSSPLSYLWLKSGLLLTDDARITGSANSTLRIANIQNSDATSYTVRVSNSAGSTTSTNSTLIVYPPISSGLVAYYPFNGNANDASGNGNNGTTSGNVAYAPGKSGMAAQFDGGCFVDCGNRPAFQFNTNDFTISAWIYSAASPNPNECEIVSKEMCLVQPSQFRLGLYQGYMNFYMSDVSSGWPLGEPLVWLQTADPGPRWAHVAVMRSGLNFAMAVDGRQVTNWTSPFNLNHSNSCNLLIGARYGGACGTPGQDLFQGRIDDVRIYNRALSAAEILQLYNLSH